MVVVQSVQSEYSIATPVDQNSNPADMHYGIGPDLQYDLHEAEDSAVITREMPKSKRAACDI